MDHQIYKLLAKQEITERLYEYCRGMDRIDNELAKTVWHVDGTANYENTFQGTGHEFVEWVAEQHRNLVATSHQISNILIKIKDDSATSETYVTMAGRIKAGDQEFEQLVKSRYIDQWSYRENRWAIDERHCITDFGIITEITDEKTLPTSPGFGRDNKSDISYATFQKSNL